MMMTMMMMMMMMKETDKDSLGINLSLLVRVYNHSNILKLKVQNRPFYNSCTSLSNEQNREGQN